MKKSGILMILLVLLFSLALYACDGGKSGTGSMELELVWSDEFDGAKLNDNNWTHETGGGGWGNGELQYYQEDNTKVEGGMLKISAKEETKQDNMGYSYDYTSSRIITKNKFSQAFGKIEARIKMPAGKGLWPAFWMLPESSPYGGWPESGEIDIFEGVGRTPEKYTATLHTGESGTDKAIPKSYSFKSGSTISDFHVYGVDWKYGEINFTCDGEVFHTVSSWRSLGFEMPAPFDTPFFIIINFAIGGVYDNYTRPDAGDPLGDLEVDYVRAYQYSKYKVYNQESTTVYFSLNDPADVRAEISQKPKNVYYKDQELSKDNYSYKNGTLTIKKSLFTDELVEDDFGLIYTQDRKFVLEYSDYSELLTVRIANYITTTDQFKRIAEDMNGHYILGCDLDFTGEDFEPIGKWNNSSFNGTLDGKGHKLKNIRISQLVLAEGTSNFYDNAENYNIGIFNKISASGIVKNLAVSGAYFRVVTGGAIAGVNYGTIENCYVDLEMEGKFFRGDHWIWYHDSKSFNGGVTAINQGTIRNCIALFSGETEDGVIAGSNYGTIDYCYGVDLKSRPDRTNGICFVGGWSWNGSGHDRIPGKDPTNSAVLTQTELRNSKTIRNNFDRAVWNLQAGYAPTLKIQE